MVQRVCLVSGGTGGHLMPALALAHALREVGHEPVLVTEGRDVERELLRRELPQATAVELPPCRRSRLAQACWVGRALLAARRLLREQTIDCVVSTGGRPAVPVGLAARSLGLPLYLLEQNAVTGRANRLLQPFARRTYLGLPGTAPAGARARYTGTPLRRGFGGGDQVDARLRLGLDRDVPTIVVTGGSQGAQVLNEVVPAALARHGGRLQVVHLSGLGHDDLVRRRYRSAANTVTAQVRPVAVDMDRLFAAADLVICRGGGTTVAELAAAGRPAVVVPYPHHRDRQQLHNARVLERVGAAVVVEEADLDAERLGAIVACLVADPDRLRVMGAAARQVAQVDAATAILRDMGLMAVGMPAASGPPPWARPPLAVSPPPRSTGNGPQRGSREGVA